jgi:hypothetical protein
MRLRWHFPGHGLRQQRKRRQRFVWRRCARCGQEGFMLVSRARICRACAS